MPEPSSEPVLQESAEAQGVSTPVWTVPAALLLLGMFYFLYKEVWREFYRAYTLVDSYYTHGFIVPFVSLYFAWRLWGKVKAAPPGSSPWGYVFVLMACFSLLLGDFLGFRIFTQFSILPMIIGICLLLLGGQRTRILWFPLFFLIFMIPIPASITQSIALTLKLFAAKCAVSLATLIGLPLVQQGSYIYFNDDYLIVGEVCGGLRSLIALLAFGALMAYLSKATNGARFFLFVMGAPIALLSNIFRIFLLCVVGYFYGSKVAAGTVHDVSGYLIFAVAFILFFALDSLIKRWFSKKGEPEETSVPTKRYQLLSAHLVRPVVVLLLFTGIATVLHVRWVAAQEVSTAKSQEWEGLDIPEYIGNFRQMGVDEDVDDHVKSVLETSEILIRPYANVNTKYPVQLTIVYAGTTRRSLHFPEVCLVGAGWEVREQGAESVGLDLTAKRLVLVKGETQQAVLYWFKTGDVLTGNFFLNAYVWAKNQLTGASTTSAMIKVAAVFKPGYEEEAFATLRDFSASFAKVAVERIP